MSTQVSTAFVNQFSSNVQLLSQQMGSLLRSCVSEESITGEKGFFDQVGSTAAQKRTTRHGDTPLMETPHSRRMVTIDTYEWADLIDDADKVRMLIAIGSGQQIAHGSADLTLAKLLSAKKILDNGSVDPSIKRYIAVAPAQIEALLGVTQVTSSDYNSVN